MTSPVTDEDLYVAIVLGGVRSPGQVTLSGHDRNQQWDVKQADGHGGASTTWKGDNVAQFTATFSLVNDPSNGVDEFAQWDTFAALLRSMLPTSSKPKALDIYHPDLAANDIKSVCQASIGGMQHDGQGGATVAVKFLEYRPPKPKSGSPSGSKTKTATADPNADLKKQLDDLRKQAMQP